MRKIIPVVLALLAAAAPVAAETATLPKIPASVAWIYVFFQDPNSVARGSGEEVVSMATPQEFLASFESYRSQAVTQGKLFIITAQTKDGKWIQDQITYNGKRLAPARYFNPGVDAVKPGAEIPAR